MMTSSSQRGATADTDIDSPYIDAEWGIGMVIEDGTTATKFTVNEAADHPSAFFFTAPYDADSDYLAVSLECGVPFYKDTNT